MTGIPCSVDSVRDHARTREVFWNVNGGKT
jgi:hypothetical protein